MSEFNPDILIAWLHDPPDKALGFHDVEQRARCYLKAALGSLLTDSELSSICPDSYASAAERLPLPKPRDERFTVNVEGGMLTTFHPLSAQSRDLVQLGKVDESRVVGEIQRIVQELGAAQDSVENRYLALWRLLPERLSEIDASYASLPADPRVPDHTIWHELDISAGLQPALRDGGGALLLLSIGPVQPFIAAAHSVRDLWSGSMILSYMAFRAMLPIIERWGPAAIVFPALRGVPLLDLWLRDAKELPLVRLPDVAPRRSPCLPNRFLAVVPWGRQGETGYRVLDDCVRSARRAWIELADEVRGILRKTWQGDSIDPHWDARWDEQIGAFFDVRGTVLPLRELNEAELCRLLGGEDVASVASDVASLRNLAEVIPEEDRPTGSQEAVGQWQLRNEIAVRLLEAQRSVRHVPPHTSHSADERYPQKCTLMGSFEQMGPANRDQSNAFWEGVANKEVRGIRLRAGEKLCAVSLTKRFAPVVLAKKLKVELADLRYSDTATVAAVEWLDRAKCAEPRFDYSQLDRWSGQWLHWQTPDQDQDDRPTDEVFKTIDHLRKPEQLGPVPLYYAVLMIDGDEMGEWLAGRRSPSVRQVMHQKLGGYFDERAATGSEQAEKIRAALASRRPLTPALHAAVSEALANYALHVVPRIIARHQGTLIYAGGDDVLALLPCRKALVCARELRLAFSGHPSINGGAPEGYYRVEKSGKTRDLLMMGRTATASAGVAVVHYKEDLRLALQAARDAEREAKRGGRDAARIIYCRRSGEHSAALCPWNFVEHFQRLVSAFSDSKPASDRWVYHLRAEQATLIGNDIPTELVAAEIRRQLKRTEQPSIKALGRALEVPPDRQTVAERVVQWFNEYVAELVQRGVSQEDARKGFITLCQGASFLARGGSEP